MRLFLFRIALIIICFAAVPALLAQELTLPDISMVQFKGVRSIGEEGFLVYYVGNQVNKGKKEFILKVLSPDLIESRQLSHPVVRRAIIGSGAYNGSHFLNSSLEPGKKKAAYHSFDLSSGTIGGSLEEKIKLKFIKKTAFRPRVYAGGKDGFYILNYRKNKSLGYSIRKVDNQLHVSWEQSYFPEKGRTEILNLKSSPDHIVLVRSSFEQSNLNMPKKQLVYLESETGNELFSYDLKNDDQGEEIAPSAFLMEADGSLSLSGMYFSTDLMNSRESKGIFFMRFDPKGSVLYQKMIPWEGQLEEMLESHSFPKAWYSSEPKVLFHQIEQNESGYQLIGETFREAASGTAMVSTMLETSVPGANLNILDYVVLEINIHTNEFELAHVIPKEKVNIWVPVDMERGLPIEKYFEEYDLFSFRFTEKNEHELSSIVFYNWGKGKPYIGYALLTDAVQINPKKIYLTKSLAQEGYSNVLKSVGGKVLIYEFDKKAKTIHLQLEKLL